MRALLLLVLAAAGVACTRAAVTMPSIYGSNMVLQTNNEYGARAFLNGFANPGEKVTVGGNAGSYYVAADENGEWKVMLNPHGSTENTITITVQGEDGPTLTFTNVSYGDVSQSNMVFPVSLTMNATADIASAANYPWFRLFTVGEASEPTEQRNVSGQWVVSTPETVKDFSAVCFLTARQLADVYTKKRPIGLIQSAVGGTRVEAWMSSKAISKCPGHPEGHGPNTPTGLWNGMIAPITSTSIRAALWYQGESNAEGANSTAYYQCMFQSMITDWRDRFGIGDFSFVFMQLPPSTPPGTPRTQQTGRMEVRAAQAATLPKPNGTVANTGMAVGIDLGGKSAWGWDHPIDKDDMAHRMALQVLHTAYAKQWEFVTPPVNFTGPMLVDVAASAGGVRVDFINYTAQDLHMREVKDCTVCCAAGQPFEVSSDGNTWAAAGSVEMGASSVVVKPAAGFLGTPAYVRYAWSDFVDCVLVNGDDLPLGPFSMQVPAVADALAAPVQPPLRNTPMKSPPMGFNSWNYAHCSITSVIVREVIDSFVSNGMAAAGYQYVNIDDCWQVARHPSGEIVPDPVRFPGGMQVLADYAHSKGLKFGVYSARGYGTCQGRPGSRGFELIDAATYCSWNLDYLKLDVCQGAGPAEDSWTLFRQGLDKCFNETGNAITFSVESCSDVDTGCGTYVAKLANLWRTGGDIQATWASVLGNVKRQDHMAPLATIGHVNDPDMLQVGNVGLSLDEQRSHFSLWCIVSAPLLAGTDVVHATNDTLAILTAPEPIAVNQDFGKDNKIQGRLVDPAPSSDAAPSATYSVWAKPLADGKRIAVVLLNEDDNNTQSVTVKWSTIGLDASTKCSVRDLWQRKVVATAAAGSYSVSLKPHESAMLTITPQ